MKLEELVSIVENQKLELFQIKDRLYKSIVEVLGERPICDQIENPVGVAMDFNGGTLGKLEELILSMWREIYDLEKVSSRLNTIL